MKRSRFHVKKFSWLFLTAAGLCGLTGGLAYVYQSGHTAAETDVDSEALDVSEYVSQTVVLDAEGVLNVSEIPAYAGVPYIVIDDNAPEYSISSEASITCYMNFSELDDLGRAGEAVAILGQETMPKEERGAIGQIKPTGWHTVKYDCIPDLYLYNRCHLIGYQLSGENANEKNLITGTRYMNVEGMLPFENMAADYIEETGNHIYYRVAPVYEGENLVASGVIMEAYSIEDAGAGLCFDVYVYNVQPGIVIDYATGESTEDQSIVSATTEVTVSADYILNTNTMRFHKPDCDSVADISEKNKQVYTGDRESLISQGYLPCGRCNP